MSGHSKWSTIKRQKGAADAKRGQLFTKLSNAITLSVKQGGGIADTASNFRLRLAVEAARNANMPKENIERAIARAVGSGADTMEEAVYEGFGPGGFSVIVRAVTDNKLRTSAEVRNLFEKQGGSFGGVGSVSYQFEPSGLLILDKSTASLDEVFLKAADADAKDVVENGEEIEIYTSPEELTKVRDILLQKGLSVKLAKLTQRPKILLPLSKDDMVKKAIDFVVLLEDHPDVSEVFTNLQINDAPHVS